jgi:hypothetical protein
MSIVSHQEYLRRLGLSNQGYCFECITENHKYCVNRRWFSGNCKCECNEVEWK